MSTMTRNEVGRFRLTLGVQPGYFHANDQVDDAVAAVAVRWQQAVDAGDPPAPPAVVTAGVAVYPTARGCPPGGERIVIVTGTRNPKYWPYNGVWYAAVIRTADRLRAELGQTTYQIDFDVVEMVYIDE